MVICVDAMNKNTYNRFISDSNCASLNLVKRSNIMEMPNTQLINLLVKYNGVFNYDDYTKIVTNGVIENDNFFIFNDHANSEGVMLFLITKYPYLIDVTGMKNAIYSTSSSLLNDIIDADVYNEDFVIDGVEICHTYNYDGVVEQHNKFYFVVKK